MNHQCDWSHSAKGDPLWLSDPDEGYVEATLVAVQGEAGDKKVIVETKDGKRFTVDAAPPSSAAMLGGRPAPGPSGAAARQRGGQRDQAGARRLLPRSQPREKEQHPHGIENMDDLHPLNEATILSNIEHRFRLDYIYTRTGPILIAMNPFKWLPIYGEEMVQQYHAKPYGALPPHCYQEAEDAFQQLQRSGGQNQSVVICGDSGAGKTETTKLMLQYISIVARDGQGNSGGGGGGGAGSGSSTTIGERLVQSNPLMEAFGNAKTLRNNNSSRFGKFTLLNFRRPPPHAAPRAGFPISGGRISNFLLEKSRVVGQQPGERNYHIFYQLLGGCEPALRARLHLPPAAAGGDDAEGGGGLVDEDGHPAAAFYYLSTGGCSRVEGVDDARDFASTRAAMDAVGIARAEQDDLFQLVAGVLHLGNVDFDASADREESSVAEAKAESLRLASQLLGLEPAALAEALTTRVRQLPGEKTVRSPQTDAQSRDSRDALAKAIYNRLFDLLVARLNAAFDKDPTPAAPFIGILDIFGFEDMQTNAFEQLLINFTNEKLQLLFNEATFKMEEEEYMREQIEWDRTDFPDNQPCVDLIEKKPMALLPILDSECTRGAAASDAALVATYNRSFRDRPHYGVCGPSTAWRKRASGGFDDLGLGILSLNLNGGGGGRDSLLSAASAAGPTSGSNFTSETDFVVVHYAGPVIYSSQNFVEKNRDALFDHVATLMATASSNPLVSSLFQQAPGDDATANALRAGSVTVAQRFTAQLNSLIQTLQGSNVRFVRCIKSNHQLQPQRMDKPSVLKQLICSGVMAALEVRRAGFPTRVHYKDFVREFRAFSVGFPTKPHDRDAHERRLEEHRSEGQLQAAAAATAGAPQGPTSEADGGEKTDAGAQEDARALTARMMLHPSVVDAVSARQYRLGVSKLFLQADTLAVLQSVRNRMILPQVERLQRWWIRLSESALAHKLKRAAGGLKAARERAELAGAHHAGPVHRALQECEAAVEYARGLGSLHPDVFRPAVNKACQKVKVLEDLLLRTLAAKEREAQQRAELLEMLDKGRAHLAHVQQGLRGVMVPEGAAVRKLAERASQGLSKQSQELLRLAKEPAAGAEEDGDREAALRQQRRKVEEVLGRIKEAEQAFERVASLQRKLEEARAVATEKLATARASLRHAAKAAESAGVQGAVGVVQQLAAAREQMQAAEEAVAGSDAAAFGHAVERVRLTVSELGHVVEEERRRKEDQDLRREGQAHLDEAGKRLQALKTEAAAAGVKPALAGAFKAFESELAAAAALTLAGDPHAYVASCRRVGEEGVAALAAALKAEKLAKQKNDEQRQAEAARLAPRAAALHEVQAAIHTQFELASEEELCRAVAAAAAALGDVKAALAKSPAIGTLRDRVDAVLQQALEAERLFAEVRQRHAFRARELEAARAQHEALGRRAAALLAAHGLGEEERGRGASPEGQVLAALTADATARAQEAVGALERDIRQWSGSPEDALRVCTLAASEALDELEAALQAQQQRLELVGKARQDEAARLKLAKDRFQAFLAAEVYEGSEAAPAASSKEEGDEAASSTAVAVTKMRLCDKAGVRATIAATETALRRAEERVRGPVSLAWLEREEASRLEEQRMVSEAVARVEEAQSSLAEQRRRHERWLRQSRANHAGAEAARAGLARLRALVETAGVGQVRSVQAAVEACEGAQDLVAKLLAQGSRFALDEQQQQQQGHAGQEDEEGGGARQGLPLRTERAIAALADKVKDAEVLVESCRAQREVEERAHAETQARFEAVLLRYQGVVGMVEAAGPVVKKLCQGSLDEVSATVNQAAHWVRRGRAAGAARPAGDGAAGDVADDDEEEVGALAQLGAKVAEAAAQVDVLEAEARAASSRVERATRLRVSEGKRLAALDETLALCADSAEKRGVQRVPTVAGPLRRAREALAAAKLKLEGELLEMWGDMAAGVMAQAEEAARLVGELEELVDREVQTRAHAEREVAGARRTLAGLAERHALAKRTAEEAGVAHAAAVAPVVGATDVELGAVRQALEAAAGRLDEGAGAAASGLASLLDALATGVARAEAAVDEEARRVRARETEAQQAALDLASMVERMDRLELVLRAASSLGEDGAGGDSEEAAAAADQPKEKEENKEGAAAAADAAVPRDAAAAAAGVAAVLVEAPHVREALEKAKHALQRVQRALADDGARAGAGAGAETIPSTEAAMSLVQAAEEAVEAEAARLRGARQRRAESEQRLRFLERKFTDLQEEVGRFCAGSGHLRVQLEAGAGEGQRCWWGTQTGASQVADGGSAASAAAMAGEPITTVQLLVEGVAAAEAAMNRARQRLHDSEGGSSGGHAGQALDEALLHIERAMELLAAEVSRVEREEEERLATLRSLDQLGDRVARVRVVAETRELEAVASVTQALGAADLALGVVGDLLASSRGAASVALPAFDVARRRVQEAEEVVAWELQRKVRRERECTAAKEQLARLKLRSEALRQVVKEFGFGDAAAVRARLESAGRALERAELALASASGGATAVATVHAEVRAVGQRLEASERAIRRERIRHEERQRAAQQREEEARLRAAREADEARRKGEMEKLKRSQLDVELEKLLFRLSLHRPTLDSIQADMARAEEAAKSARHRLADGDITDAQVATEAAYCLAQSFEQTISSLRNGGGGSSDLVATAIAEEEEERGGGPRPAFLDALASPTPAASAVAVALGPSERTGKPPVGETAGAAAGFQAYMEKTTATLDTMAQSIQALMHTVSDLNTSVLAQRRKLDEHAEVLASPDNKLVTPTRAGDPGSRSRPSSAFGMDAPPPPPSATDGATAARRHKASDDITRSLAPALVDEGATADAAKGAAGMDASSSLSASTSQRGAPKEAPLVFRNEKQLRRQLQAKDGDEALYERLKRISTQNDVTIEDCILCGTMEDNTLQAIAGDGDSYAAFKPVFERITKACQPHWKPGQRHPMMALKPALLAPDVEEEQARRGEPGFGPGAASLVRCLFNRCLAGRRFPPRSSLEELREVERSVVPQLERLTGELAGSYTSMEGVLKDRALQKELGRLGLDIQSLKTPGENAGENPHWPAGRGVFLNQDRSLCVIVNLESHLSLFATASVGRQGKEGPAALAQRAFALACKAMEAIGKGLSFDVDPELGFLTPSGASVGTALAFMAALAKPPPTADEPGGAAWKALAEDVEERFKGVHVVGGMVQNRATLGWSEVDTIRAVLNATRYLVAADADAAAVDDGAAPMSPSSPAS